MAINTGKPAMKRAREVYNFMADYRGENLKVGKVIVFEDDEPFFIPSLMFFVIFSAAMKDGARFRGEFLYKTKGEK